MPHLNDEEVARLADEEPSEEEEAHLAALGEYELVSMGSSLKCCLVAEGKAGDPGVAVDPSSAALLMFTAAFSGTPNAAMLSHTAVLLQDLVMGMMQEVTCDYIYLNCGPLFHVATFMTTMTTFHFGGTNVFTPRVEAEELCRLIESERCTGAFIMGPTIGEILEQERRQGLHDPATFDQFRARCERSRDALPPAVRSQ